jgi:hypothetical protein
MQQVAEHGGLGRFMGLTETRGAYVAHPLGGCRMAGSPDLGVVDSRPRWGSNPSLTISAVSERCAEALVARAGDLGLPARPAGLQPGLPPENVGERVIPLAAPSPRPPRRPRKRRRRRRNPHRKAPTRR